MINFFSSCLADCESANALIKVDCCGFNIRVRIVIVCFYTYLLSLKKAFLFQMDAQLWFRFFIFFISHVFECFLIALLIELFDLLFCVFFISKIKFYTFPGGIGFSSFISSSALFLFTLPFFHELVCSGLVEFWLVYSLI